MGLSDRIDRQQILQMQPDIINNFYHKLVALDNKYHFKLRNIINFDETRFMIGQSPKAMVFYRTNRVHCRLLQDGSRKFLAMTEATFADGKTILPFAIYKGKTIMVTLGKEIRGIIPEMKTTYSNNGWINNELALKFAELHLWLKIQKRGGTGRWLFIFNGHRSNVSLDFILFF